MCDFRLVFEGAKTMVNVTGHYQLPTKVFNFFFNLLTCGNILRTLGVQPTIDVMRVIDGFTI